MKTWKIPVRWEVFAFVKIDAETLEDAISQFDADPDMIPLPSDEAEYIDGSFEREEDEEMIKIYNK